MKVIFLDIDGVLNNKRHITELQRQKKKGLISDKEYFSTWFLPYEDTMIPLQKIVKATNAKIVLTSSWRLYPDKMRRLNKVFDDYGLKISGKVSKYVDLFFVRIPKEKIYSLNKIQERTTDRGALIQKYLEEHKRIKRFVIISDTLADITEYFEKDVIVRTVYGQGGLNEEKAQEAIEKLKEK